jgi:hypothetical protein
MKAGTNIDFPQDILKLSLTLCNDYDVPDALQYASRAGSSGSSGAVKPQRPVTFNDMKTICSSSSCG